LSGHVYILRLYRHLARNRPSRKLPPSKDAAMASFRPLFIPLLLLALTGCKLIDQTTFFAPDPEPAAAAPAQATAPEPPASQPALVTIRYDRPQPAYEEPLAFAIRAAEQRRPGGEYDVVGVSIAADAGQTARDASTIMAAMVRLGVAQSRIHLGAQLDPARTVREVRVQLR